MGHNGHLLSNSDTHTVTQAVIVQILYHLRLLKQGSQTITHPSKYSTPLVMLISAYPVTPASHVHQTNE
jgi:hypothetical protein